MSRCTDLALAMITPGLVAGPLATLLPRNTLFLITKIIKMIKTIKTVNNSQRNHLESQVPSWGLLGEGWTHPSGSRGAEESSQLQQC